MISSYLRFELEIFSDGFCSRILDVIYNRFGRFIVYDLISSRVVKKFMLVSVLFI